MKKDKEKKLPKMRGNGLNKVWISFVSVKDMTLGEIYGSELVPITALTKILWAFIKNEKLLVKNKSSNESAS